MAEENGWRLCSACKKPIEFGAIYWICNVSTCNRKSAALVFCSLPCWEVHLPTARHREAWAEERRAPRRSAAAQAAAKEPAESKRRTVVRSAPPRQPEAGGPQEILIVASRLKEYVHKRSGFNTSDRVLDPLSDIVRRVCDEAIRNAAKEGRKTILDRDIPGH